MLKKLGLAYADQSFNIGGVSIRVQIVPGHEYISIIGGGVTIYMDSGVVNVGFTNSTDYRRYFPGEMHKPSYIVNYDAPFSIPSGKNDGVYVPGNNPELDPPSLTYTTPWFRNPSTSSSGQFSGELTGPNPFRGLIRRDGVAKSFEPQRVKDGDGDVVPNPADETLVGKKLSAYLCPPSMFTGKARLYAQALFGQYLYDPESKLPQVVNEPPAVELASNTYPSPNLRLVVFEDKDTERVKAFKDAVDADRAAAEKAGIGLLFRDPYDVRLTVSSGVYLDAATGTHWLIEPQDGSVIIYRLAAPPEVENLRRNLKADSGLSQGDKEKLEAYLLSASRPHVETRTWVASTGANVNPYSMGYGWHWAWSMCTADMVDVAYSEDGTTSAHYRLTVSISGSGSSVSCAASYSTIEPVQPWNIEKSSCSFTCPIWRDWYIGENQDMRPQYMSLVVPYRHIGTPSPCDVPIYAFYQRDNLVICRLKIEVETVNQRDVSFTNGYAQWTNEETGDHYRAYYTAPGADGRLKDLTNIYTSYTQTISCGGISRSITKGLIKSGTWSEIRKGAYVDFPDAPVPPPDGLGGYNFTGYNFYPYGSTAELYVGEWQGSPFAQTYPATTVSVPGVCYTVGPDYAGQGGFRCQSSSGFCPYA